MPFLAFLGYCVLLLLALAFVVSFFGGALLLFCVVPLRLFGPSLFAFCIFPVALVGLCSVASCSVFYSCTISACLVGSCIPVFFGPLFSYAPCFCLPLLSVPGCFVSFLCFPFALVFVSSRVRYLLSILLLVLAATPPSSPLGFVRDPRVRLFDRRLDRAPRFLPPVAFHSLRFSVIHAPSVSLSTGSSSVAHLYRSALASLTRFFFDFAPSATSSSACLPEPLRFADACGSFGALHVPVYFSCLSAVSCWFCP